MKDDHFTAWDDFKFTVGGLLLIALPLALLVLVGFVIYSIL